MPDSSGASSVRFTAAPSFVEPLLVTTAKAIPKGPDWIHEFKFDGYRLITVIDSGEVRFFTRSGSDWTSRFPALARAFGRFPVRSAVLDGELVSMTPDGVPSFSKLQVDVASKDQSSLQLHVFDLMHLDGEDLRHKPLIDRRRRLADIFERFGGSDYIHLTEWFDDGAALFKAACNLQGEGVVSKRISAPYVSGRSQSWLRSKCFTRQEFVVGGFTAAPNGVASLYVGNFSEDGFRYAGKVGTGFDAKSAALLRKTLDVLKHDESPFVDKKRSGAPVQFVRPELTVEVSYLEMTPAGRIRHSSFKGIRLDKPARQVTREEKLEVEESEPPVPEPYSRSNAVSIKSDVMVAGVPITHPSRVLFPETGETKLDLVRCYYAVADHILPHIAGRPLSTVRCPGTIDGECFFQRSRPEDANLLHLHSVDVMVKGVRRSFLRIDDLQGLIALAQWGVVEIHPWGSRQEDPLKPDRVVFDFDPAPDANYTDVVRGALEVKQRMAEFGLQSFLKTTGGKGLHVVIPIAPRFGWPAIKAFSQAVAMSMAHDSPNRYVATISKAARTGKVFIDYLRNEVTATSIAAFSVRTGPGAPVSLPVSWSELAPGLPMRTISVQNVPSIVENREDPWPAFMECRQELPAVVLSALRIPTI